MQVGYVKIGVNLDGEPPLIDQFLLDGEDLDMPKDEIKKLVGDGEARVAVSVDLSDKDFGSGFGTHVTVSLTCDQNSDTLDDAFVIAKALAADYAEQAYEEAEDLFRKKMG